jgi:hypothetical protein
MPLNSKNIKTSKKSVNSDNFIILQNNKKVKISNLKSIYLKYIDWIFNYDVLNQQFSVTNELVIPFININQSNKNKYISIAIKALNSNIFEKNNTFKKLKNIILEKHSASLFNLSKKNISSHPIKKSLFWLSYSSPKFLFQLFKFNNSNFIKKQIEAIDKIKPRCLIISHLGYPMGGGESYLFETAKILSESGIDVFWASFYHPDMTKYEDSLYFETPFYHDLRISEPFNENTLNNIIYEVSPSFIHSQGASNSLVIDVATKKNLNALIGYHFWLGLINLNEKTFHKHIVKNIKNHSISNPETIASKYIHKYVASNFMLDVYRQLGGKENVDVIYPIPSQSHFLCESYNPEYILQINLHPFKGGEIFHDCIYHLGNQLPFLGVMTEDLTNPFYEKIRALSLKRSKVKISKYGKVKDHYSKAKLLLLPTLADETFCRVAYEATLNKIPVISTENGNLKYIYGDTGFFLGENSNEWVNVIPKLFYSNNALNRIANEQYKRLKGLFTNDQKNRFLEVAHYLIQNSKERNIGLFGLWGDTGLGYLMKIYAKCLNNLGYRIHIFSFQSYATINKSLKDQVKNEDWNNLPYISSIYYSFNHREEVTDYEILQFIEVNSIGKMFFIEICWEKNWQRIFSLQNENLKIFGVPMIECVIDREVENHNRLFKTLACNKHSEEILKKSGVNNISYIGHGFGEADDNLKNKKIVSLKKSKKINFVHVAGHNPIVRKNTSKIIDSFIIASKHKSNITLTIYSKIPIKQFYDKKIPSNIKIIDSSSERNLITNAYKKAHVSIQVPSHEGLGLGFYESLSSYTPVITLKHKPHSEIVLNNLTGWTIDSGEEPMKDNVNGLVTSSNFEIEDLARIIGKIDIRSIEDAIGNINSHYFSKFSESQLTYRLSKVLN